MAICAGLRAGVPSRTCPADARALEEPDPPHARPPPWAAAQGRRLPGPLGDGSASTPRTRASAVPCTASPDAAGRGVENGLAVELHPTHVMALVGHDELQRPVVERRGRQL